MPLDNPKNSFLFKELEKKNSKYAGLIEQSWEVAEKSLRTISAVHPNYTSHGPDHALALLNILDRALEPLGIDINEEELYILISATLLHDIGMVGKIDADESNRNRIRSEHHLRSKTYILENYSDLYIERKFKKQIAEAASAHRKLNINEYIIERKIGNSNFPHPRLKLIAALLRMADECHITEDRIPEDYRILNLPKESLKHFQQHFNNIGLEFDKTAGEIKFTVEIANEEVDKLFKLAKTKIQKELDELQVILKKHNVPYSKINFIEEREELVQYKIIKMLLAKGPLTKNCLIQLLKEQGEEETSVTTFLDVSGEYEPFELIHENGQELYKLLYSEKVFYDLANRFLFNTNDRHSPLLFMESMLTNNILSDEFLLNLLKKSISLKEPKDKIFCIIRKSPSALRYLIRNRDNLPQKRASGVSGLNDSLKGELQNDFIEYPELLLEPGLLEDIFDEKECPEIWRRFKVNQIAQYHTLFDINKLSNQWVSPNKWELKANFDCRTNTQKFKTTFTFDRAVENPMHLMIAAYRMNLPCRFEETNGFKIELMRDNKNIDDKKQESMVMMEINPHGKNTLSALLFPARFDRKTGKKYVIEILDTLEDYDSIIQDYPFLIRPHIVGKPDKDKKNLRGKLKMTFGINWDVVDCQQAALMIKVREARSIEFHSKKLKRKIADLSFKKNESKKLFSPIGDKDFEKVILKLGRIQRLLQKTLPFPLSGLPENIYKLLLKCRLRSRKEVRSTWNKIKRLLSQEKVQYQSPIVAKIVSDGHTIGYIYLDSVNGIHFPNIKAEFSDSKIENPQDLLQKALEDPKQRIELVAGNIILSPQAAIEYLKEHKIEYGTGKVINPIDIKDIMANSPEEHNTRVTFKWFPENDYIWYKATPFVLQLEKLTWERWLIEADHLSNVEKDVKRAYIARKEAFRIAPQNPTVLVAYGWSAYLCKRVQEAIQVTKQILNDKEDYSQFIASVNLGLYHLDKSLNNGSKTDSNLESAEQFYKKAISILDKLEEREKVMAVHSAIEDLIENKERLHEKSNHYLITFQKYDEKI